MTASFVHLKVHTEFSLHDGIVRIKPLVKAAVEAGMPAVAMADDSNLCGLIKFYQAALGAGVKPVFGVDLMVREEGDEELPFPITLLAQNSEGYANLRRLISKAWLEGQFQGRATVCRAWVAEHADGVIALSGAREGEVGRALIKGRPERADEAARWWLERFPGRYYLELQRTGRTDDENHLHATVELAARLDCPVVATNDVRFLAGEEFEAHEVRVCIAESRALDDPRRQRRYSDQQYLKTAAEMIELFADIPEAIENTVIIARRCSVPIQLGTYYLPEYPVPAGLTMDTYFRQVSHDGLSARLAVLLPPDAPDRAAREQTYRERLDFELDTIVSMGFPGYFLIVMDFIRWAKDQGIPVGPGRGSGAGSLVAYALLITDLDPLAYDLLFERFLNPERVSMPDFDIDFCMEGRDRVISYVADRYGRDAVSQIITFGTLAAKAAVRDVARAQGKSYGMADKLSKMIPFEPGMTLDKAYEQEKLLREHLAADEQANEVWEMAKRLEGVTRNVGKHAGGVVIAPTTLTDFAPLHSADGEGIVTQYDKGDVEEVGLVKFDFLGLRTLTIIDWAVAMINRHRPEGEEPLDISAIPLDDPATFKLLQEGQTTAVFQLESRGMKDLIRRLQPSRFEDIIALVALFRPGPLQSGMVDDFINRKHGRAEVAYPHPKYQHQCLQPVLEPTYGIILYQEQVMQIAQAMGGYSLGGADLLRRAMGKKKPEEMAKQRELFLAGAEGQGFDADLANNIFDLMEKFAGYGFNKSHSAAYALVSYQTAWLKTHYPAEFMAATMSSDMDKTEKVVTFIEEARNMGLAVEPPDVNRGEFQFSADREGRIIYGLGAIKGLGEGPIESIIEGRRDGREFTDLFDFCARTEPRKVNKRALEALIRAGAFDGLGTGRALLQAALPDAVRAAEQSAHNASSGIDDLFGEVVVPAAQGDVYAGYRQVPAWSTRERLKGEKDTLGLYVSGHPVDDYLEEFKVFASDRISDLRADNSIQAIAGLVVSHRIMKTRRGDDMGVVVVDDRSGRIEVTVFSEELEGFRRDLVDDMIVVCDGLVSQDDREGGLKMRASRVRSLLAARRERIRAVVLALEGADFGREFPARLRESLGGDAGRGCALWVDYRGRGASGRVVLGESWQLDPSDDCLLRLRQAFGPERISVEYGQRVVPEAPAPARRFAG